MTQIFWHSHIKGLTLSRIFFIFCIVLVPIKALSDGLTKEDEIRAMQYLDGVIQSQIDNEQREITFDNKPIPKFFCEEGRVFPAHQRNATSNLINFVSLGFGSMWNVREDSGLPKRFFTLDVGYLGLPNECVNRKIFFGAKLRYEHGFDINLNFNFAYRLGVEGYYHPQLLNLKGHQIASLLLGFGYRFRHTNLESGNYVDLGLLLYPSFPIHLALTYRMDYASDTPSQHSMRLSLKIPLNLRKFGKNKD